MFVAGLSRKGGMKQLGGSEGRGCESETRVDNDYLVSQRGEHRKETYLKIDPSDCRTSIGYRIPMLQLSPS